MLAPQGNLRLRGRGLISTWDKMRSKNRLIYQDITGKDVHTLLRPARSAPFLRVSAINLLRRKALTEVGDATDGYQTMRVSVQCTSVQEKWEAISSVCLQRHICLHFSTLLPVWHRRLEVSQNSQWCWSLGRTMRESRISNFIIWLDKEFVHNWDVDEARSP